MWEWLADRLLSVRAEDLLTGMAIIIAWYIAVLLLCLYWNR